VNPNAARTIVFLALSALLATGCEDLRQFTGQWSGPISPDPNQQHGFDATARMDATVGSVSRYGIDLTLTLPGATDPSRFELIRYAAQDVLADMRLPGDPLRTYLGFIRTAGQDSILTVVSLYAEARIEVRLIRGTETTYGVFMLVRPGAENASKRG
jgi:hypothetical protein